MSPELQALASRIAALYPNGSWARPGMACRDLISGDKFRRLGDHWKADRSKGESYYEKDDAVAVKRARAIASGPMLTDDVTAVGLLALLPNVRIDQRWGTDDSEPGSWKLLRWWVGPCPDGFSGCIGATRAEAIARAVIAARLSMTLKQTGGAMRGVAGPKGSAHQAEGQRTFRQERLAVESRRGLGGALGIARPHP